ncbi:hypothetical protein IW245_006746 [Longispora fulva]|uniref:Uncharacterized protein n=1 Tax=Longispora fulva TaxID=619741 RepID=A0A8J7KZ98_9ACTN|nr:hypothetical protein [Longispora fulva]
MADHREPRHPALLALALLGVVLAVCTLVGIARALYG